jgi:aminoglycoside phosphotransferase (APT) family kinase protein
MGRSPLILAALATDAVPGLNFSQVKSLATGSGGAFDSILLTATSGDHFVLRSPLTAAAGVELETELRAIRAIGPELRAKLPFVLTNLVGETKDPQGGRALLFSFVYGNPIDIYSTQATGNLAMSIASAVAAIHNLPLSVVQDAGLPGYSTKDIVRSRVAELDRAAATGLVPAALLTRWETAFEDVNLFRFQPTVVHGDLSGENMLELDDSVAGVLSWNHLRIGDPADDFAWIVGAGDEERIYNILLNYQRECEATDANLRQRATIYSELLMARWLLHGINRQDQTIIDDATAELKALANDLEDGLIEPLHASGFAPEPAAKTEIESSEGLVAAAEQIESIEMIEIIEKSDFSESESTEAVDDKTRPIDLIDTKTKSDDELF